jgi:AraC-like DNA-binding protein
MVQHAFRTRHRAMTAHASELTARANRSAPSDFQSASQVRVFADALARLGFDVDTLLEASGIGRVEIHDPDGVIPCAAMAAMMARAGAERRTPNLLAHMGAVTPIGAYPLLDYLVVTTDTVGRALEQLARFFHITSAPITWRVVHDGDMVRMVVEPGFERLAAEYTTSIALHHLRVETDGRLRASSASFTFEPDDKDDLERLFGCPVHAPTTWSGFELTREMLDIPLRRRDPALRGVLEGHAAAVVAARDAPSTRDDRPMSVAVCAQLVSSLAGGAPPIAVVARRLNMSPRTLQRRLSSEGFAFEQLVDDVRRGAAERLLADASLSVGEIGYLLGFSEPSAFHRAFKRWHAATPQEYRRRASGPSSPQ